MKGAEKARHTTTMRKTLTAMVEMFLDRTTGETFNENRLITRVSENGNVALIAYGWIKIAEYSEERNAVTVFAGHKSLNSKTINKWLNKVVSVAEQRNRDIILSGESPTVNTPNEGVKFIGSYVSFGPDRSAVEQQAVASVREDLRAVA